MGGTWIKAKGVPNFFIYKETMERKRQQVVFVSEEEVDLCLLRSEMSTLKEELLREIKYERESRRGSERFIWETIAGYNEKAKEETKEQILALKTQVVDKRCDGLEKLYNEEKRKNKNERNKLKSKIDFLETHQVLLDSYFKHNSERLTEEIETNEKAFKIIEEELNELKEAFYYQPLGNEYKEIKLHFEKLALVNTRHMSIKFNIRNGQVTHVEKKLVPERVMTKEDRELWEEQKDEIAGVLMEIAAKSEMDREIEKLNKKMSRDIERLKKRLEKKYGEYGISFI